MQRSTGIARIAFKQRAGETVLDDLFQSGSARVRMARAEPGRLCEAVLINTSGGMTGGDNFKTGLNWGMNTMAIVTTQAAERHYKSLGEHALIQADITIKKGAVAFWLPQEAIMFDGAIYRRQTSIDMHGSARFLGIETSVFGRTAMNEIISCGRLNESWKIRINGKLVFADAFSLADNITQQLGHPSIAAGATTLATIIYKGPQLPELLEKTRSLIAIQDTWGGATLLDEIMVVRLFAKNSQALRINSMIILDELMINMVPVSDKHSVLPRVWSL